MKCMLLTLCGSVQKNVTRTILVVRVIVLLEILLNESVVSLVYRSSFPCGRLAVVRGLRV